MRELEREREREREREKKRERERERLLTSAYISQPPTLQTTALVVNIIFVLPRN